MLDGPGAAVAAMSGLPLWRGHLGGRRVRVGRVPTAGFADALAQGLADRWHERQRQQLECARQTGGGTLGVVHRRSAAGGHEHVEELAVVDPGARRERADRRGVLRRRAHDHVLRCRWTVPASAPGVRLASSPVA